MILCESGRFILLLNKLSEMSSIIAGLLYMYYAYSDHWEDVYNYNSPDMSYNNFIECFLKKLTYVLF